MALSYLARLDVAQDTMVDSPAISCLVRGGETQEKLHYLIEVSPNGRTSDNAAQVYYRNFNTVTYAISAPIAVSGPEPFGAHSPSLVKQVTSDGVTAVSTWVAGYSLSKSVNDSNRGFRVKESEDDGQTWINTYSFPGFETHQFHGLYANDDGSVVLAVSVSNSNFGSGQATFVHYRIGPMNWQSVFVTQVDPGNSATSQRGYWTRLPQQNMVIVDGQFSFLISGWSTGIHGSFYEDILRSFTSLYGSPIAPWHPEYLFNIHQQDASPTYTNYRHVPIVMHGTDGAIRIFTRFRSGWINSDPDVAGYAVTLMLENVESNAIPLGLSPGLYTPGDESPPVDENGQPIRWPREDPMADSITACLDPSSNHYITFPQAPPIGTISTSPDWTAAGKVMHTYKGYALYADAMTAGPDNFDSMFIHDSVITPHNGVVELAWNGVTPISATSLFVEGDYYRTVATWNASASRAEIWLLRDSGIYTFPTAGHTGGGGGGTPKHFEN